MREYIVRNLDKLDWSSVEEQTINECSWSPNPAPAAGFKAVLVSKEALYVLVKSYSAPSRAENTEPDSSVWEDSCLEFFFSLDGASYVNLEVNANSALRASFGASRRDRKRLREMGIAMPEVKATRVEAAWQVEYKVPQECIKALWGRELAAGDCFRANFYSCGDKTPAPHFASWNPVETETPDFHRPEYFGLIKIED